MIAFLFIPLQPENKVCQQMGILLSPSMAWYLLKSW